MVSNPWLGVVLFNSAVIAAICFAHWHVAGGEFVFGAMGIALSILAAHAHATTRRELTTLRQSMRPGSSASLPSPPTIPR
jgi:hypothetical protein